MKLLGHKLLLGATLVLLAWVGDQLLTGQVSGHLGVAMAPVVLEAELEAEVERSLKDYAKGGGDVELGHELGTSREVDRRFAKERVEADVESAQGLADSAHNALVAARLAPFLMLLKLIGALLIVLGLVDWLRGRPANNKMAGLSGAMIMWVMLFDVSGWLNTQTALIQTGMASFRRYMSVSREYQQMELDQAMIEESFATENYYDDEFPGADDSGFEAYDDSEYLEELAKMDREFEESQKQWDVQEVLIRLGSLSWAEDDEYVLSATLTDASIERLQRLLTIAQTGGPAEIGTLSDWERAMVGVLRLKAKDSLQTLSLLDAMRLVDMESFWFGGSPFSGFYPDVVTINGDTAVLQISDTEGEVFEVSATLVGGTWKLDIDPFIETVNRALQKNSLEDAQSVDDTIDSGLRFMVPYGTELGPELWEPPE